MSILGGQSRFPFLCDIYREETSHETHASVLRRMTRRTGAAVECVQSLLSQEAVWGWRASRNSVRENPKR